MHYGSEVCVSVYLDSRSLWLEAVHSRSILAGGSAVHWDSEQQVGSTAALCDKKRLACMSYDAGSHPLSFAGLQVGEIMDGRYEVFATHGKGVFSSVLRARDKQNPVPGTEVAIKMIRANETMYKAAQTEKVGSQPSCGGLQTHPLHCAYTVHQA